MDYTGATWNIITSDVNVQHYRMVNQKRALSRRLTVSPSLCGALAVASTGCICRKILHTLSFRLSYFFIVNSLLLQETMGFVGNVKKQKVLCVAPLSAVCDRGMNVLT